MKTSTAVGWLALAVALLTGGLSTSDAPGWSQTALLIASGTVAVGTLIAWPASHLRKRIRSSDRAEIEPPEESFIRLERTAEELDDWLDIREAGRPSDPGEVFFRGEGHSAFQAAKQRRADYDAETRVEYLKDWRPKARALLSETGPQDDVEFPKLKERIDNPTDHRDVPALLRELAGDPYVR